MKWFWIASLFLLVSLSSSHARSRSSSSSSKSKKSLSSTSMSERVDCNALRNALNQAIAVGSLDVPFLLSDVPLTSLNSQLDQFLQDVSSGDVACKKIDKFVKGLEKDVEKVIKRCDLDSDEEFDEDDLDALLEAAFDVLFQDLIEGLFIFFFKIRKT